MAGHMNASRPQKASLFMSLQTARFPMMFEDFWAADDAPPHSFLNKDSAGLGTGPMGFARALLNYQAAFGCEAVKFYSVEGILAAGKRVADVIARESRMLARDLWQAVPQ